METFEGVGEFEAWLGEHHATETEVWLRIAKEGARGATLSIGEALDVALCFGWIDSQRRSYDDSFYAQRYSPRRPGSQWSRVNVDRAQRLIAQGRMREPGLAQVASAKADGRWDAAYASQATAEVPEDLLAALRAHPAAARAFDALGKTQRYQIILGLLKAKSARTRAARLAKAITTLDH
ncbi:YdeI/OmpD-associated family protein [Allorhizocola rhizosphaerae]|uniref:YdeI/OmpD-associated family protein n=1 Tax=Allorhizocola rhizosphaerae TaxID=1872709 RepID=UPI000E3C907B|nr:YdeI/OmpD-associated family protein [Allorhizocola rhizosphaerae]